jgi:hypothetical protein
VKTASADGTRQPCYPYLASVCGPISWEMNVDLDDEQAAALIRELGRILDDDRYPLSPRIMTLKSILAKFRPDPIR